jgi:hypothetical protein
MGSRFEPLLADACGPAYPGPRQPARLRDSASAASESRIESDQIKFRLNESSRTSAATPEQMTRERPGRAALVGD